MDRNEGVEVVDGRAVWAAPRDVGTEVPVGDLGIVTIPALLKFGDQRFHRGSGVSVVIRPGDRRPSGCSRACQISRH